MSVSSSTTETYCDVADVEKLFPAYEFDATTEPSAADVEASIAEWSDYIDRETHHAWRANRVEAETHDQIHLYYWLTGHPINLLKRDLRPLDAAEGDKLEVWTGNRWEDWLQDDAYKQGRDEDFWLDAPVGQLWVYERAFISPHPKFRITYRYGKSQVPNDIRRACAKLVAQDLIHGDFAGQEVPGAAGQGSSEPTETAKMWYQQAHNILDNHRELGFI